MSWQEVVASDQSGPCADAPALLRSCARAEQAERDARRMLDQRRRWEAEGMR
jgi:hypothetical protein